MSKLKNKPLRYKNVRIDEAPMEKFPDMVEISKAPAKLKKLVGKKYINEVKARLAIDNLQAENIIASGHVKSSKELMSIGLGNEINF